VCSGQPAWNQLISDTISADKQIYLITTFFSDPHQVEMIERLSGDDAQNFIDTIDKVGSDANSRSSERSIDLDKKNPRFVP